MRQYWVSAIPAFHVADGTAVTGGTSLADMSPAPNIVIPSNSLELGSRLEIDVIGRFTSAGTPGTVVLGVYLAASGAAISSGQGFAISSSLTLTASQTNRTWKMSAHAAVRAVGSSGSILGAAEITNVVGAAGSGGTDMAPATAPTAVTYDTTVPLTLRLGVTPSVTTQSWTVHFVNLKILN